MDNSIDVAELLITLILVGVLLGWAAIGIIFRGDKRK